MRFPKNLRKLVAAALSAQKNSYCPYSQYAVGAAVMAGSGKIYEGCNVESPTLISHVCAERSAIFHAISHGERSIEAVCTVSKSSEPCGSCRQLIREFSPNDTPIYALHVDPKTGKEKLYRTSISRLLPRAHTENFIDIWKTGNYAERARRRA